MSLPLANLGAIAVAHLGKTGAVSVTRLAAGTYVDGVWTPGAPTTVAVAAVVYPSTPRDLMKLPEGERANEAITILSAYAFRTSDVGGAFEADAVTWNGKTYRVMTVGDWNDQGVFTAAVAVRSEP